MCVRCVCCICVCVGSVCALGIVLRCCVLRMCACVSVCLCVCSALLLCVASFLFACAPGANCALCVGVTHTHTMRDARYVCACTLWRCFLATNVASNMQNDFCCSLTRCLICVRYMWQSRHKHTRGIRTHTGTQ